MDPDGLKQKTTYDYDAANRVLAQHVDPDGLNLTTRYEYDGQGRAVRITDPNGVVTRYDLDGEGRLKTQVVDEGGLALTTRTTYDAQGRVLTVRREAGTTVANASAAQVTEYHYDLMGRRIQEVQDPAGIRAITTYDYDAAGQVVRVSDTLGVRKRYVYDAAGRETYCIDALGGTERKEYDAEGRLLRDTHYAKAIVTSGLPVAADAQQVKDLLSPNAAADLVQRLSYNKDGRLRFVIDAQGGVSETRYDNLGRVSQTTAYAVMLSGADLASAMNLATSNGDINTLVGKIDDAARDRTTRFAYDGAGRLRFAVDAVGAVTETVYDKASRVIRTVQYANTLGSNATVQAPTADATRDRITRTVYDAAGRAVQQVDAEGYLTVNQYDKVGNLGMTLRYVSRVQRADALTQGASVAVLSATATPPAQGAYVLEDSSLTNITSFQYDRLNRRTISIDVEQKFEVSVYNDALGASVQRYNRLGGVATLVYDALGRLVQETLPVTSTAADGTEQPVINRHEYDVRGNRTKSIEAVGLPEERTTVYRFDAMNRLVRKIGMAYAAADGNGSLTSVTPLDVFGYNALGQLETQTAHAVLLDADQPDGATRGGRITTASYDKSGRKVAEIAPDGVRSEFGYDAFGDLVQQRVRGGADGDRTMHFSYDAVGRKTATQLDGVWAWEFGQPVTLNAVPDGTGGAGSTALQTLTLERLEYDSFGNVLRHTDARGNADYAYYDRIGRKLLTIDTAGYATAWDYARSGSVATQETRYAKAVPVAYDVQGKGPTAQALRSALDQAGADPDNRITQFTLDRLNRVTRRSVLAVSFAYATPTELKVVSGAVPIMEVTGTAQAVTEYSYDGLGHVTQIREQVGQTDRLHSEVWQETAIEYDLLGREISRSAPGYIDAAGVNVRPVTTTRYDGVGNIASSAQLGNGQFVGARLTRYSYNGNGQITEMTDAAGNVVRYNFDAQGDLASQFHIN
ncbi:MAG TPA: hypothetical protein VFL86_01755, partial [Burkholderiaceae bacterium]|nr:hypothetical protein [Burkholderiaceae bacterium]